MRDEAAKNAKRPDPASHARVQAAWRRRQRQRASPGSSIPKTRGHRNGGATSPLPHTPYQQPSYRPPSRQSNLLWRNRSCIHRTDRPNRTIRAEPSCARRETPRPRSTAARSPMRCSYRKTPSNHLPSIQADTTIGMRARQPHPAGWGRSRPIRRSIPQPHHARPQLTQRWSRSIVSPPSPCHRM